MLILGIFGGMLSMDFVVMFYIANQLLQMFGKILILCVGQCVGAVHVEKNVNDKSTFFKI